jgi:hypothetical protein
LFSIIFSNLSELSTLSQSAEIVYFISLFLSVVHFVQKFINSLELAQTIIFLSGFSTQISLLSNLTLNQIDFLVLLNILAHISVLSQAL